MRLNSVINYRSVLISTRNKTNFQTHFSPILDLLSDSFDCGHVQPSDGMESGIITIDLYTAEYAGEIISEVTKGYV